MTTIPLSTLPAPVRDRLVDIAIEWLGFDPWTAHEDENGDVLDLARDPWFVRLPDSAAYGNALPLHLGAGFDLAVRLVADRDGVEPDVVRGYINSGVWSVRTYGPATTPTEKLAALVRGLA